jgi:GntR family transcriptional repressor for pyruvate dehydrogenase complex
MTNSGSVDIGLSRASFRPVVVQKASDSIADQIRERIFSGQFERGSLLPPEAELARQTASSRASVRAALRTLEGQGLIRLKPGRAGGAIVRLPGEDEMRSTVNHLIRGQEIKLDELLDLQEAVEPICAKLAARSRTDEDLEDIGAALAAITGHAGDVRSLLDAHSAWHVAVSRASHNELFSGLMVALVSWINMAVQESKLPVEGVNSKAYEEITAAIRAGDQESAGEKMRMHVISRGTLFRALSAVA